jgi:hypothetical protein
MPEFSSERPPDITGKLMGSDARGLREGENCIQGLSDSAFLFLKDGKQPSLGEYHVAM